MLRPTIHVMRADLSTDNAIVERIQKYFREDDDESGVYYHFYTELVLIK